MKRCSVLYTLALAFLLVAGVCRAAELPSSGAVNGETGQALITALGERLLILDVRTQAEFDQGHVPGALLIPVQELKKRLGEIPEGRPILILCRTGRRAAAAYDILSKARPDSLRVGLWYLDATPEYNRSGTFRFK